MPWCYIHTSIAQVDRSLSVELARGRGSLTHYPRRERSFVIRLHRASGMAKICGVGAPAILMALRRAESSILNL